MQTFFSAADNVTGLSNSTNLVAPTRIGARFRITQAGYILAVRWFRVRRSFILAQREM